MISASLTPEGKITPTPLGPVVQMRFTIPCVDGDFVWSHGCHPDAEVWRWVACQDAVDSLANTSPLLPKNVVERYLALRSSELKGEMGSLELACQYYHDRSGVPPDQRFRRAIEALAHHYEYMAHELRRELEELWEGAA